MFPVKCKDILPVDHIAIRSIAVRGQLGPLTVWVSKLPEELPSRNSSRHSDATSKNNSATTVFRLSSSHWHKIYQAEHQPSQEEYCSLKLDSPIILKPGQVRAIYIHSTLPGDQAIVYDNASFYLPRRGLHPFHGHHGGAREQQQQQQRKPRYEDPMLSVFTGRAHVSNTAFGQMPIWGWGNAWRDHREFVGQLEYGAVYQLWNPEPSTLTKFGPKFKDALWMLKMCQTRWESPMSRLPDECIYYILNMCRWDWFQDSPQTMQVQKQIQVQKQKQQALQRQMVKQQAQLDQQQQDAVAAAAAQQEQEAAATVTSNDVSANHKSNNNNNNSNTKTSHLCPCPSGSAANDQNDDSDYDDVAAAAAEEHLLDDIEEDDSVEAEVAIMSEDEDGDAEGEWDEDDEDFDDSDDDADDRADHHVFR